MSRIPNPHYVMAELAKMDPVEVVLDAVTATVVAGRTRAMFVIQNDRDFEPMVVSVDLDGPDYGVALTARMQGKTMHVDTCYRWPLRPPTNQRTP